MFYNIYIYLPEISVRLSDVFIRNSTEVFLLLPFFFILYIFLFVCFTFIFYFMSQIFIDSYTYLVYYYENISLWYEQLIYLSYFPQWVYKHMYWYFCRYCRSTSFYLHFIIIWRVRVLSASFIIFLIFCLQKIVYIYFFLKILHRKNLTCYFLRKWVYIPNTLQIDWVLVYDMHTLCMGCLVIFISLFVFLYSTWYMRKESILSYIYFFFILFLFSWSMLCLIFAGNFIIFFFFWEMVGLCSYLLINFWNFRLEANKSALKAVIVNKISDFSLYCGILCFFYTYQSFDFCFLMVFTDPYLLQFPVSSKLFWISFFLFFGAVGKSSQFGLHFWLPDAMEGPTPVSSLLHAATMVTAGVHVLLRFCTIFEQVNFISNLLVIVGCCTVFFASCFAISSFDIKKILAYSTMCQIGFMFICCGFSCYNLAFFHLIIHALYKCCLFLCAGVLIELHQGEQDIRYMQSSLQQINFFVFLIFLISCLSLIGFPFTIGFISKELIFCKFSFFFFQKIVYYLLWLSTYFYVFCVVRCFFLFFFDQDTGNLGIRAERSSLSLNNFYGFSIFSWQFCLFFLCLCQSFCVFFDILFNYILNPLSDFDSFFFCFMWNAKQNCFYFFLHTAIPFFFCYLGLIFLIFFFLRFFNYFRCLLLFNLLYFASKCQYYSFIFRHKHLFYLYGVIDCFIFLFYFFTFCLRNLQNNVWIEKICYFFFVWNFLENSYLTAVIELEKGLFSFIGFFGIARFTRFLMSVCVRYKHSFLFVYFFFGLLFFLFLYLFI